jgi:hypothetical protein
MRKLEALRAFGVTVGGSALLTGLAAAIGLAALRALQRRERPPALALAGVLATATYVGLIRPWHLRWGSRPGEAERPLPGDHLLPPYGAQIQHSITIDAPVDQVWPWLAQIGQDRGGFYSYEWLENLAGCKMQNADSIHPEWQHREVGETVFLHPAGGLEVTMFDPPRALGLRDWGNWVLEPEGDGRTRLYARGGAPRGLPGLAYALFMEIPHFVMQRRMLLGVKQRAERQRQLGRHARRRG